jgi:dipeptidyl aminopeptidase/acylaminoacyl peptidase
MSRPDGKPLSEIIGSEKIPVKRALQIGVQIAEKLEKAHEQGVVHGNLTAEKVVISPEGRVEVREFGGRAADRQSDILSFGSLLYQLVSGRPALETPDWRALPPSTPLRVRVLLERCLQPDPTRRLVDIGDALMDIEEALDEIDRPQDVMSNRPGREVIFAASAFLFFLFTAVLSVRLYWPAPRSAPSGSPSAPKTASPAGPPPIRFDMVAPFYANQFHLSPDGQKIAFTTHGFAEAGVRPRLWVRAQAPGAVFWSVDSKYVGFIEGRRLKKVMASGGVAEVVCDLPASTEGAAWDAQDVILIGQRFGPLLRVPATGGKPEPILQLDTINQEEGQALPNFLPVGKHFLYVLRRRAESSSPYATFVGQLGNNERHPLPGVSSEAKYLNGHILFVRDGVLMGQGFDITQLTLNGEALPIEKGVGPFSVSSNVLAYAKDDTAARDVQLVWLDRKGSTLRVVGPTERDGVTEMSPDGKLAAFQRFGSGGRSEIWIRDLETGSTNRLSNGPEDNFAPRWAPDSKRVAFSSFRDGGLDLYEHAVDAVGPDKPLLKNDQKKTLTDWSPDGQFLIYISDGDIWALPIGKSPIRITNTTFAEDGARVSRDGRWIAFTSDEKGEAEPREVYIQSFPQPGVKKAVSEGGGLLPHWSADGNEIFFLGTPLTRGVASTAASFSYMIMTASVKSGSSLEIGVPKPLFSLTSPKTGATFYNYNVSADNRFLVRWMSPTPSTASTQPATGSTTGITLILNWAGNER